VTPVGQRQSSVGSLLSERGRRELEKLSKPIRVRQTGGVQTPEEYLAALEPDRRDVLEPVHDVVQAAVPPGYERTVDFGMISWVVPLSRFPDTYNGRPLGYVSLAAQKRHCSLYLMGLAASTERELSFRQRWTAQGRELDMGKACLRFRRVEDLDLDLVTEAVASAGVEDYLELYATARA
jgi:hypothetical protein